jgi:cellulose synthase/poly-beta-1,6-N-acetylglucosamine synthase-like glycosyltransferase
VIVNGSVAVSSLGALLALDSVLVLIPLLATLTLRIREHEERAIESYPPCTVVIPAHNEAEHLAATVASIVVERLVDLSIIIVDDGSTDKTFELATSLAASDARICVRSIQRGGKAKALNEALSITKTEAFVTVDADTHVEAGALRALLANFDDDAVDAVSGFIVAKERTGSALLGSFQRLEYLKASALRTGFSILGMHEQAPGAFTAFRTASLKRVGGFPDSLTEDYEVIFRLYDLARQEDRRIRIVSSPSAIARTSPVCSLRGLFEQRTRWFAGFLMTLWRYRSMIFDKRLGRFGLLRLPHKVLDAGMPLVLALALLSILSSGMHAQWPFNFSVWFLLPVLVSCVFRLTRSPIPISRDREEVMMRRC